MESLNRTRRKFKSKLDDKQTVSDAQIALMGQGNGTVIVPNQPGYVYFRTSGQADYGIVFNNRCPVRDDLRIYVGYDPITDPERALFQVLSVSMGDYAGDGGSTPIANVGPHGSTHEWGGGDDVYVEWRRIMGLRVGRPALFIVTVDPGVVIRAGAHLYIPSTNVDLTAEHAALVGTQACYVLIYLDSAGAVQHYAGAPVASIAVLTIADCPTIADVIPPISGGDELAAVRLYVAQMRIGDTPTNPDIWDLRFPTSTTWGFGNNWNLLGNSGTIAAANFVGTTDNIDLVFRRNNLPKGSLTSTGFRILNDAANYVEIQPSGTCGTLTWAPEISGAVIVRSAAPNIVGGAFGATPGNVRGNSAVDLQLNRANATEVASGTYSTICGGLQNTANGLASAALGGASNNAGGDYSVACGRFATIAAAHDGSFLFADWTNAAFNSAAAGEAAFRVRGGFRWAYDDSNWAKLLVSAAGVGTFTTLPVGAGFVFTPPVTFNGAVTLGDAAADNITVNGTITSNLIFTDNTYDIGAVGATRPRHLYMSGNATIAGSLLASTTPLALTQSTNGAIITSVNNSNAGAGASARFRATSDTVTADYTAYSAAAAGGARLNLTASGGYMIIGTATNHDVIIYTNNTSRATFAAAGGFTVVGAFGCNAAAAQTAYASGGALAAYATGAFGLNSDANMSALHAMVVKIRAALVANGIMS